MICVCLSVCVPNNLANPQTDMVFLFRVLLIGPGKVYNYFWGGYHHPPKRNNPEKKITSHPNIENVKPKGKKATSVADN